MTRPYHLNFSFPPILENASWDVEQCGLFRTTATTPPNQVDTLKMAPRQTFSMDKERWRVFLARHSTIQRHRCAVHPSFGSSIFLLQKEENWFYTSSLPGSFFLFPLHTHFELDIKNPSPVTKLFDYPRKLMMVQICGFTYFIKNTPWHFLLN